MGVADRRKVGEIFVVDRVAVRAQPVQRLLVVDGVPEYDGVHQQGEAQCLVGLALALTRFRGPIRVER